MTSFKPTEQMKELALMWAERKDTQALIAERSKYAPADLTATEAMIAFRESARILMEPDIFEAYKLTVGLLITGLLEVKRSEQENV